MTFPARGVEIIQALYKANPQDDAARRIDIQKVGEQFEHEFAPRRWGNKKRAGLSDDFRSPDSIAYREDDGTISVWDIQASSGQILVYAGKPPDHPHLPASEATFMVCQPVNHLGTALDPGTPPDQGTSVPELVATLKAIEAELALIRISLAKLHEKPAPAVVFPDYEGGPWYARMTLKPKL